MFGELERTTNVDVAAFSSLTATWRGMLGALRNTPVVLLVYRDTPPLFEQEVVESFAKTAAEEQHWRVSFDLDQPPQTRPVVFLIHSRASLALSETLLSLTKHLVESRGEARFVFPFPLERMGELRSHACFPLLEPYINEFEEIPQDPLSFLTQFTMLSPLPAYTERNLWTLLFYAAALALEETKLDEDQLHGLTTGLRRVETTGGTVAFYNWHTLPPSSKLARLYFDSISISPAEEIIARADERFYLAKCFRWFVELGNLAQYLEVAPPDAADQLQLMVRLREQQSASQRSAEAIRYWHRLGLKYLLGENGPPYQSMGPIEPYVQDDPGLRRLVEKVGEIIGAPSPFAGREMLIEAAEAAFNHLYPIVTIDEEFEATRVEELVSDFLSEYERRVTEYKEGELQCLIVKTVNIALMTYACFGLHGRLPSDRLFGLFPRLWSKCVDSLGSRLTIRSERKEALWQSLSVLSSFDQRFSDVARRLLMRAQEVAAVQEAASQALKARDPVDTFVTLFATQLREHDFFLDIGQWDSLALPLAESYSRLDDQLLEAGAAGRQLTSLILNAESDTRYDRVFVLIVDGLSYLEWKLIKHHHAGLADEGIDLSESYAFAPVPSYTPGNTTCLITGFHPSEIGVCDWSIKPLGQDAVDLKDEAAKLIIEAIQDTVRPKQTVTLVHNQMGSNLTYLWTLLAEIEEVPITTTQTSKAIAQVRSELYQLEPAHKTVVVYIPDFDEAGHWHLRMDGWKQYYSLLGERIRDNLLLPIFTRAKKQKEKTLVILTADHGKLSRYESKLLALAVPRSGAFDKCADLLEGYEFGKSSRHIVAWIPEHDLTVLNTVIGEAIKDHPDVVVYAGDKVAHFLPHTSRTHLVNPNLLILSRFGISGGGVMGHGGGSLSEVVVPEVHFTWK